MQTEELKQYKPDKQDGFAEDMSVYLYCHCSYCDAYLISWKVITI